MEKRSDSSFKATTFSSDTMKKEDGLTKKANFTTVKAT